MKWTTPVTVATDKGFVRHGMPILMMGSCFADNIGFYLQESKFDVCLNPYGTLYNPESIACAIERLAENRPFVKSELRHDGNLWYSYMHHGSFSAGDADATLQAINRSYERAARLLPCCQRLIVTWGTAYVYKLKETGETVANCHKQPEKLFERTRMATSEIIARWEAVTKLLHSYAPQCRVLLTVSPIRHLRDGAHPNQLSKATLLLAADALCQRYPKTYSYFPAYEIVMDELRDYRFYADDMTHPSTAAVTYIRERFAEAYFSPQTAGLAAACEKIATGLRHRPLKGCYTPAYRHFAASLLQQMDDLTKCHETIDYTKEKKEIEQLLQHNGNEL